MRSRTLMVAILVVGLLTTLGGCAGMLVTGSLALLINPHGGFYGGSREEVATFALVSFGSGILGDCGPLVGGDAGQAAGE